MHAQSSSSRRHGPSSGLVTRQRHSSALRPSPPKSCDERRATSHGASMPSKSPPRRNSMIWTIAGRLQLSRANAATPSQKWCRRRTAASHVSPVCPAKKGYGCAGCPHAARCLSRLKSRSQADVDSAVSRTPPTFACIFFAVANRCCTATSATRTGSAGCASMTTNLGAERHPASAPLRKKNGENNPEIRDTPGQGTVFFVITFFAGTLFYRKAVVR